MNRKFFKVSTLVLAASALVAGCLTHEARRAEAADDGTEAAESTAAKKVSLVYSVNNFGYTGTCG